MELENIKRITHGVPHTTPEKGEILYKTVVENNFSRCLELGFASGVGSCFIAGALDEIGAGRLVSVDRPAAKTRKPTADELLQRAGLRDLVELIYDPVSYNWYLKDCIKQKREFDFCFIDGAHTWEADGLAFFLTNECLASGGMIIFDDLDWTFNSSPTLSKTAFVQEKPEIERTTKQVRDVFEILVKNHSDYVEFVDEDGWGYARKK